MAIRRSKMREQVIQNLSQVAPPGEQFIACVHTETGPSPWLNIVFDEVPFLGLIVQSMRKYYFITLTNNHIVVNRAGRMTNRPKEVVVAVPVQANPFSGIKKGKIWSRMYFQFPGETAPTRMNFHRIWNSDVDHFIAAFPHAVDASQAPVGQQAMPQQQYGAPAQYQQQYAAQQQYQQPQGRPYPGEAPQQGYPGQASQQAQPYPGQAPQQYQQGQFPQQYGPR